MAVNMLVTLVLRSGSVVRDVVTGRTSIGSQAAKRQAPTLPFPMRHPSHRYPMAEPESVRRLNRVDAKDVDNAADRAGRPGSGVGVPHRRCLVQVAGLTGSGSRSWAGWRFDRFTVGRRRVRGLAAASLRARGLRGGRRLCQRSMELAGGTLPASTRGRTGG
jgi:hypothetical protein